MSTKAAQFSAGQLNTYPTPHALLQQHLAGEITLSEAQQSACDLSPDGKLTISDQLRLEQLLTAP